GAVAAHAYARLSGRRDPVKRVVLIGPAHRAALRAMALPGVDAFETPLGQVPLDQAATADLAGLAQVRRDGLPHAGAHSRAPRLLELRGSGQITGELRRVVGYGAVAVDPP